MSAPQDSGSIQSHPSTSNSQKRLRVTLTSAAGTPHRQDETQDSTHPSTRTGLINRVLLRSGISSVPGLPGVAHDRQTFPRAWSILLLKWIAAVYCLLSCLVLTIDCYKYYLCISLANNDVFRPASYMNDLSLQHRLSRITTSPNILSFEPYLLGYQMSDQAATSAGLWIEEKDNLDLLPAWTLVWPGPLSVVMTTTEIISSPGHSKLLRKIYGLKKRIGTSQLCLHLLHIRTHNSSAPNAYLNLARLFAPTSRVVLFPAPVAILPPDDLYRLVNVQDTLYPSIITTPLRTMYPFTPLAPILFGRNYSAWCTERHFVGSSRTADWSECVWQVWIETMGKAAKIIIDGAPGEHGEEMEEIDIIHRRTSTIFRSEYCDIVTRQNRGDAKIYINWLKYFCARSVDKRYRP